MTSIKPLLSTGSEQQGQNTRVRKVFLNLIIILDLLVFFHQVCKKRSSDFSEPLLSLAVIIWISINSVFGITQKESNSCLNIL